MKMQEERFSLALYEETLPLLEDHAEELNVISSELDVDVSTYLKAQLAETFIAYTLREEGKMIGYIGYFLFWHPHYRNVYTAQQDVLFLDKDYRKGLTGIKLIKYSEKKLKNRGVKLISQHSKSHTDLYKVLEFLKYKEADSVYIKEI